MTTNEQLRDWEKEFDKEFTYEECGCYDWYCEMKDIKSFIKSLLSQASKEAWIDGFLSTGEGHNGEYLGSSVTKGRTIEETVATDIYEREHPHSKDEK